MRGRRPVVDSQLSVSVLTGSRGAGESARPSPGASGPFRSGPCPTSPCNPSAIRLTREERKLLTKEEREALEAHLKGYPRRGWTPRGGTWLFVVAVWAIGLALALLTGAGWWVGVSVLVATVVVGVAALLFGK